jgi:hypothetical protein
VIFSDSSCVLGLEASMSWQDPIRLIFVSGCFWRLSATVYPGMLRPGALCGDQHGCELAASAGSVAPGKMGGHKPRKLIGAHRVWLLERTKTDFTLRGLRAELAERGIKVDYRTVWSFAHTEGLSFKKKRASRRTASPKGRPQARAMEEISGAD